MRTWQGKVPGGRECHMHLVPSAPVPATCQMCSQCHSESLPRLLVLPMSALCPVMKIPIFARTTFKTFFLI